MKKAVHYLNQFFGQIGGENQADIAPQLHEGHVGPGMLLHQKLAPVAEVTHTVICGDNFIGSKTDEAIEQVLTELETIEFDIFIAGPAFLAGRYGLACGALGKAVQERFRVPVIASMNEENPAVEMYAHELYIFSGGANAAAMRKDVKKVADFSKRMLQADKLRPAAEEGYFSRGKRLEAFDGSNRTGAERAVEMLLKKLNDEPFHTEMPMPVPAKVAIAPAVEKMEEATIALVSSGGIVPKGNPDHIQSASATKWGKYEVDALYELEAGSWETIHGGFDPSAANQDPNVIVPLDAMRELEQEAKLGSIHPYIYSTVGTGTTQAEAARMGTEIAKDLQRANVSAVILTST